MSFAAEKIPRRGRFITLEGGEGAGKSTQLRLLVDRLQRHGLAVIATREPGGTPLAEVLRDALLIGAVAPFGPAAEALVFSAARIDHIDAKIAPALGRGEWVVCDRFIDSTRAYQGTLGAVDGPLIDALEGVVVGPFTPDLTIVLDVPSATGLARAAARRPGGAGADRFEREDARYHDRLRNAFLAIARLHPLRCHVIDGSRPPDAVADAIWSVVEDRLLPGAARDAPGGPPA